MPDRPPGQPVESSRSLAGQFLAFVGPLVSIGGVLAMLRTNAFDWFFALLVPAGIVMWWVGMRMKRKG